MPTMPWSQPGVTLPAPRGNGKACPRSQDASNCLPVDQVTPTYFIVSWSPAFAAGPEPTTMSVTSSLQGIGPSGTSTTGFFDRSVVVVTLATFASLLQPL